jgi:hypothetical protein
MKRPRRQKISDRIRRLKHEQARGIVPVKKVKVVKLKKVTHGN